MLIEPLQLTTPIAAFNGGVYVRPDMSVIEQQTIPDDLTSTVIELLGTHELDVWIYRGATGLSGTRRHLTSPARPGRQLTRR